MLMLVLAGGLGTRLNTAVPKVPKVLAPINDVPFLKLQIKNWTAQRQLDFVFLLSHKHDQIIDFLKKEIGPDTTLDVNYQIIIDESLLGTGGSVKACIQKLSINEPFLVINGDTWLDSGLSDLKQQGPNTIGLIESNDRDRFGSVTITDDGYVLAFDEKAIDLSEETKFINGGVYCLTPCIFEKYNGSNFSIERDLFPSLMNQKILKGLPLHSAFVDIGIPSDYVKAANMLRDFTKQ